MTTYKYRPLKDNHFRLVELLPGYGDLEIHLHEDRLDRAGPFSFLSYVRGRDFNHYEYIECEGHLIQVSWPLYNFLRELRRDNPGHLLWIDVVCINGADVEENMRQLQMLPQINGRATSTICWVDAPEPCRISRLVADLCRISRLTPLSNLSFSYLNHDPCRSGSKITPEQLRLFQSETDNIGPEPWEALDTLLGDTYFQSMWTSLDWYWSNELLFKCGGAVTISWDDLCLALGACFRFSFRNRLTSVGFFNLLVMDLVRKRSLAHQVRPTLYEVFSTWHGCDLRASYDTDYAFVFLGIAQEDQHQGDFATGSSGSIEGINWQVASALEVLSLSLAKGSSLALPPTSWVPDWRATRKHFLLNQSDSQFSASPNIQPDVLTDPQSRTLQCRGIIADSIKAMSSYLPPRRPCDHYIASGTNSIVFEEWFEFAKEHASRSRQIPYNETKLLFQYAETIQARGANTIWETEWDESNVASRMRGFLEFIDDEDAVETLETRLFYASCFPSHGHRFGITERGYYSLLSPDTKKGDLVCIVYGNNVPILLRQHVGHYQNLGECYINGLMHYDASVLRDCEEVMFNII